MKATTTTTRTTASFSSDDCELLAKFEQSVKFNQIAHDDQARLRDLRSRVKSLIADSAPKRLGFTPVDLHVSHLCPSGNSPKDFWCCVFPSSVGHKSFALQIAFIISPRGAEICCCLGAGEAEIKNNEKAKQYRDSFEKLKSALASLESESVDAVDQSLGNEWRFRSSWRLEPGDSEFDSLQSWLEYAGSNEGQGASISRYIEPNELDHRGDVVDAVFSEAIERFEPLFDAIYTHGVGLDNAAKPPEASNELDFIIYQPAAKDEEALSTAFANFHDDVAEQTRVQLRRKRAEQLRMLLSSVDAIRLDIFNRDVWVFESATRLGGEDIKGRIFSEQSLDADFCERIRTGLDNDALELHGNYLWGSATRVYGPQLKLNNDEKLENLRTALRILNDATLPPIEKAKQIRAVPGFGFNMATGLVMVYHPDDFAIWNKQSKAALKKLGYDANDLSSFQASVRTLREDLGADDFLELDWFLYLINQNSIQIGLSEGGSIGNVGTEAGVRYWAMGLGQGGRLWKPCLAEGIIAIGWDFLGDFNQYNTKEEFAEAIGKHRDDGKNPMNSSHACYQFVHEMKVGDYVFAKKGMSQLYGCGVIESNYIFDPDRSEYRSIRRVRWLTVGNWTIPENARVPLKTLTDVTNYHSFMAFAFPIIKKPKIEGGKTIEIKVEPYNIDNALEGVFLTEDCFTEILNALARKKNVILQGPPGVGKTFIAKRLAYALLGFKDSSKVEMVQFHQSYSYEDFIQGYRPEEAGGFRRRDGIFHQFCRRASADDKSNYVFIIDEINRGNLSKIFGELLMLIEADKRGPDYAIPLTYAKDQSDRFFIPDNLYIIGMMNTADRSLAMVDYALRRRFTFIDLQPEFDTEDFRSFLEEHEVEPDVIETVVVRMLKLNEEIRAEKTNLGRGFEIGHSFFCPQGTEEELSMDWYRSIIRSEIAPLLREYWFDDLDKAEDRIMELLK